MLAFVGRWWAAVAEGVLRAGWRRGIADRCTVLGCRSLLRRLLGVLLGLIRRFR